MNNEVLNQVGVSLSLVEFQNTVKESIEKIAEASGKIGEAIRKSQGLGSEVNSVGFFTPQIMATGFVTPQTMATGFVTPQTISQTEIAEAHQLLEVVAAVENVQRGSGSSQKTSQMRNSRGPKKAKKQRKILKDSIQGITKPAIRRLARRGGVKRISGLMYEETRGLLRTFLENTLRDAIVYAEHSERKTITSMDIVSALKRQGKTLYGHGG